VCFFSLFIDRFKMGEFTVVSAKTKEMITVNSGGANVFGAFLRD